VKSMTGYGQKGSTNENLSVSVEIKSYNNRFLDIYVNAPPFLSSFEPRIRELVATRCVRGKVEISLRLKELHGSVSVIVDENAALAYFEAISSLGSTLGIKETPHLSTILALEGVLSAEKNRDMDALWLAVHPVLLTAMEDFESSRVREGVATTGDILKHIAALEAALATIATHVPLMEASIKENLRIRFRDVLGDLVDENRILTETAVLLMKYTISEELARLGAHLTEFRNEVATNPAPGKKLDFLCQEINREINTIGSKTPIMEVSRAVVTMKDALENIREQLRNVE